MMTTIITLQGVSMVIDACANNWKDHTDDTQCASRAVWKDPLRLGSWVVSSPLQVGGLVRGDEDHQNYGWSEGPITQSLNGCLSHISINGQVRTKDSLEQGFPTRGAR